MIDNAFAIRISPFFEQTKEDWDIVMNVGLKGIFFCIKAAGEYMVAQGYAKIVNMSSINAICTFHEDNCIYAVIKSGVIAVTKVAVKMGPFGVNINALAPRTIMTSSQYSRKGKTGAATSFKRWQSPAFLAVSGNLKT